MICFLIFLYLYSIIYTLPTIKFSYYIFLQKNQMLLLLHISKSVQFFVKFAHIFMEFQLISW